MNHILVLSGPKIKFYAGAPITLPTGENIGSLCVIDSKPRHMNLNQQKTLINLAQIISSLVSDPQRLSKGIANALV